MQTSVNYRQGVNRYGHVEGLACLCENNRVLYYGFRDPWTFSDLLNLYVENRTIRDQYMHRIHTLANLTATRHQPRDIMSTRIFSPDANHPRGGYVFMIGPSAFVRSVFDMTIRLLRTDKIQIFSTEEQAWTAIRAII